MRDTSANGNQKGNTNDKLEHTIDCVYAHDDSSASMPKHAERWRRPKTVRYRDNAAAKRVANFEKEHIGLSM